MEIVSAEKKQKKEDITQPLKSLEGIIPPPQRDARAASIGNASALLDAVAAISSPSETHPVAKEAARQIINFSDADICAISRWDSKTNEITLWAEYRRNQPASAAVAYLPYDASEYPTTQKVLHTARPEQIHIDDLLLDPGEKTIMLASRAHSLLMLPLVAHNATIGLIEIFETKQKREFSEDHIANIHVLAQHAAISLERARLLSEAEQRAAELETIRQASLSLTASLEQKVVFNSILQSALRLSPYALDAYIFTFDEKEHMLNFGASRWATRDDGKTFESVRPGGLTATVANSGEIVCVEDVSTHPLFQDSQWVKEGWQGSIIGMPLKSGQEIVGVMNIAYRRRQEFSEDQLRVLGLLADQAALAIVNARLHEMVKRQAITDQLTGLPNRRAFDVRLDSEIKRSNRYNHKFSLMMIDVDHFKSVNDTYGHLVGDKVLKTVGRKLATSTRDTDMVARYGGDEFAIILPETTLQQANMLAEKFANIIAGETISFQEEDEKVELQIGLSIGVASYPTHGSDAEILISSADHALYRAKEFKSPAAKR
jgi:diguanylate cyclase (GGDEF)-like protein